MISTVKINGYMRISRVKFRSNTIDFFGKLVASFLTLVKVNRDAIVFHFL